MIDAVVHGFSIRVLLKQSNPAASRGKAMACPPSTRSVMHSVRRGNVNLQLTGFIRPQDRGLTRRLTVNNKRTMFSVRSQIVR